METRNYINGYFLLEQDLKEILSFVEPAQENYSTYSHRLYSLFIRACTEFEANCKAILLENEVAINGNANIADYYKIHNYSSFKSINEYHVKLQVSQEIDLQPLMKWEHNKAPLWYAEYNSVKHSRVTQFKKANLENVLNAIAAVYILLYARFENSALNQYQEAQVTHEDDDGFIWADNSLFKIKAP